MRYEISAEDWRLGAGVWRLGGQKLEAGRLCVGGLRPEAGFQVSFFIFQKEAKAHISYLIFQISDLGSQTLDLGFQVSDCIFQI